MIRKALRLAAAIAPPMRLAIGTNTRAHATPASLGDPSRLVTAMTHRGRSSEGGALAPPSARRYAGEGPTLHRLAVHAR